MIDHKAQEEFWFNEYVMAIGRMSAPYLTEEYRNKVSQFAAVCHAQYLIFEVLAEKSCR